jgi:hypothetical protein
LNPPYWEKVIGDDYSAVHAIRATPKARTS